HVKEGAEPPPPENRRLGDALFPHQPNRPPDAPEQEQVEINAELTWNDREVLRQADFDTMTADEWREAQRLLSQLKLVFEPLPTRRTRRATRPGSADWRATLQAMARHGGELWDTRWRAPRIQPAPLLVLADISGSMSRYSRMLLHFGHLLGHSDARVESFVFGTRLTRTGPRDGVRKVAAGDFQGVGSDDVLESLADGFLGGVAAHSVHCRARVGDLEVEIHRPDDVRRVFGHQAKRLFALLEGPFRGRAGHQASQPGRQARACAITPRHGAVVHVHRILA
ncbi:MAG TPA: VWA domain-containing protein, partial [Armatimonadota bacterium]|nr:VWA domain-containing protein [Armatimonadota bacterium]